jgi:acetoin:2,6-dichlorophenolindophenol oxidoreductase subunit beta
VVLNLTYAQAAALALEHTMRENPAVVVLGEDVGRGGVFGQYRGLLEQFGDQRVIDTPISESTIVGAAVGMALAGARPVAEMRVMDFALCAMDEIVNQAAKNRFMFGGQGRVPVVIRMPIGIWSSSAAQHSQSLESWFVHLPGVVVMAPSTPQDNYSMLRAALTLDDPVVYLEHKELWATTGPVDVNQPAQLGQAHRVPSSTQDQVCIVSWSKAAKACLQAQDELKQLGIKATVMDLRTLWPWDQQQVLAQALHCGRLLVVHEAVQVAGLGAEIVAWCMEQAQLQAKPLHVKRLGAPRIPVGYAPALEAQARIGAASIVAAVKDLVGR